MTEQLEKMKTAELESLVKKAITIINGRKEKKVIRVRFDSYNVRRFSKPWIALVVQWSAGDKPSLEFGYFYGDDQNGGFAEIEAKEGDIIRWGQRDNRGNNTKNCWGVFRNGQLDEIAQAEARTLFCNT